jgi:dihydropteroate synthase
MRPVFEWNLGSRSLELGGRTLVMGVVNVTPDSFSDGGKFLDREKAVEHAERLLDEGADIIDVGGESTRPGARIDPAIPTGSSESGADVASKASTSISAVSAQEELDRVIPVIAGLKKKHPSAAISVDTYKAAVARSAVNAGAEIVNDVSGLRWDPEMARTVADLRCGVVLMHMRGRPEEWRKLPPAADIIALVKQELSERAEQAIRAGLLRGSIVLDPGFGFGKNFEQNYPLIARFSELHSIGFPLLAGASRKSFIGRTLRVNEKDAPPQERLYGTLATQTALVLEGAHILRTHDVRPSAEAARIADAILGAG